MKLLYDKTGAAFSLDHEIGETAYVRPMVKVIARVSYGDDFHEEEDTEPAAYLVAMDRSSLFDEAPIVAVNADIAAARAELEALRAETKKLIADARSQRQSVEWELQSAKRQLEQWMKTHKGMVDLGKLLDGKVLYPLSVDENRYTGARVIPHIPKMKDIRGLRVEGGDFEKGKEWRARLYLSDHYNTDFQFFDTEEERAAVILSEFEATCKVFRQKPDFRADGYSTTLSYETLEEWVKRHPALRIPDDIKAMKAAHDAELVEKRKAALAAELAAMQASACPLPSSGETQGDETMDTLECEFEFEEMNIVVNGKSAPGMMLFGTAMLTGDDDGFSVTFIELEGGTQLRKRNGGTWAAMVTPFEDELFARIAAVIENRKTAIGAAAEMAWCKVREDAREAA